MKIGAPRYSFLKVLSISLLLAALIKVFFLVVANPLIGYANNYDFIRESSCTALWMKYADRPKTSGNAEHPVNKLELTDDFNPPGCLHTVDNIFPRMATRFHKIGDFLDFREISIWRVLLVLGATALLFWFAKNQVSLIWISLIYFFTIGDFWNILYYNTLYSEFSVIWGGFFSFAILLLQLSDEKKPKFFQLVLTIPVVVYLAVSKFQYSSLAILLAILIGADWVFRWRKWFMSSVLVISTVCMALFFNHKNKHMTYLNLVYQTDTFFWAVLPEASDVPAALKTLGLPEKCSVMVGKNGYGPEMLNYPCPEITNTSRSRLIPLFLMQPNTFVQPLWTAMLKYYPSYPINIFYLEDERDIDSGLVMISKNTSLMTWLGFLSPQNLAGILIVSIVFGLCVAPSFIRNFVTKRRDEEFLTQSMIFLGAMVTFYSLASSVFGDGYAEVAKHAVLVNLGLSAEYVGLVALIASQLKKRRLLR